MNFIKCKLYTFTFTSFGAYFRNCLCGNTFDVSAVASKLEEVDGGRVECVNVISDLVDDLLFDVSSWVDIFVHAKKSKSKHPSLTDGRLLFVWFC